MLVAGIAPLAEETGKLALGFFPFPIKTHSPISDPTCLVTCVRCLRRATPTCLVGVLF